MAARAGDESVLESGVFEELATLVYEQLLLLGTAALIAEHPEASVSSQQVHVSCIVNFPIRSPELFGWGGRPTVQEITSTQDHPALTSFRIGISDKNVISLLGHLSTRCAHQKGTAIADAPSVDSSLSSAWSPCPRVLSRKRTISLSFQPCCRKKRNPLEKARTGSERSKA